VPGLRPADRGIALWFPKKVKVTFLVQKLGVSSKKRFGSRTFKRQFRQGHVFAHQVKRKVATWLNAGKNSAAAHHEIPLSGEHLTSLVVWSYSAGYQRLAFFFSGNLTASHQWRTSEALLSPLYGPSILSFEYDGMFPDGKTSPLSSTATPPLHLMS